MSGNECLVWELKPVTPEFRGLVMFSRTYEIVSLFLFLSTTLRRAVFLFVRFFCGSLFIQKLLLPPFFAAVSSAIMVY